MDTKTDSYPIINVSDEEQRIDNQPPAYSVDCAELKTVLPLVSPSGYMQPDPPMCEVYRSIFTLALCFWPFGIIAMLKSLKGIKAYYNGDRNGAAAYTRSALRWNIAAIVIGAVIISGIINGIVRTSITLAHLYTMQEPDCNNGTITI